VTADASGNYAFTGLSDGAYTVTPAKNGYTFTPASQTVTISGASRTGVSFAARGGVSANLTVDASQVFQTIDGMGVNINVNSWSGGQLRPALDYLVDTNGSSLFRVVRDPMTWVSSESLIPALHALDPTTLQQVYETLPMQDLWSTIGYLNSKGIVGSQIILNFMGWTPAWLGGSGGYGVPSYITAGKEPEFATPRSTSAAMPSARASRPPSLPSGGAGVRRSTAKDATASSVRVKPLRSGAVLFVGLPIRSTSRPRE
jgi:hypothetical protein